MHTKKAENNFRNFHPKFHNNLFTREMSKVIRTQAYLLKMGVNDGNFC